VNEPRPLYPREALVRAVVALAAVAAMAVFAAREASPACDEGAYLAVLAGAGLLAVAFLAPPPALELGIGAPLATAALWALPPGPGRGAAVTLLLAALFAWTAARRLAACLPALPVDAAVPLAFGAQVLLRGGLLFHPQPNIRTLVALLVLPAAAGLCAALLAQRHGTGPALLAAATALLLAPGWNVAATLGLIALTAGDQLSRPDLDRLRRGMALVVLLAPIAWEPGPGVAAAVAGLALWRPRIALGASVPLAAALFWAALHGHGPAPEPLLGIAWLALLVPTAVQPEPERAWYVPTALILAASVPRIPDVSVLAAPLALAALSLPRKGTPLRVQAVWTGAVLAGTALLAGYPWMREEPLSAAVSLVGLTPSWRSGAVVAACAVLVMAAGRGFARGKRPPEEGKSTAREQLDRVSLPKFSPLPGIGRAGDGRGAGGEGAFRRSPGPSPPPTTPRCPSTARRPTADPLWVPPAEDAAARRCRAAGCRGPAERRPPSRSSPLRPASAWRAAPRST
jgi:hypothetical protein